MGVVRTGKPAATTPSPPSAQAGPGLQQNLWNATDRDLTIFGGGWRCIGDWLGLRSFRMSQKKRSHMVLFSIFMVQFQQASTSRAAFAGSSLGCVILWVLLLIFLLMDYSPQPTHKKKKKSRNASMLPRAPSSPTQKPSRNSRSSKRTKGGGKKQTVDTHLLS